jgi:PIN domain nuclease of toxin-antitoxin system
MNLLLDTHIWIWNDLAPHKISSRVAQELASSNNELWLSPVSIWELVLLIEKKKLRLVVDIHQWVADSARDLALKEVPLTWDVAQELPFVSLSHGDPADRFLVATARTFNLTLVTGDQALLSLPNLNVLANV